MPTRALDMLVCRPQKKGEALTNMLVGLGFHAVHLETFTIKAKPFVFSDTNHFTDAIFTSTHAVDYFFKHYSSGLFKKKHHARAWSIGKTTQTALLEHNIHAFSPDKYHSEALLSLLKHQDLQSCQFIIIKGQGGRNLLQQALSKYAKVTVLECYQRVPISADALLKDLAVLKLINPPKIIVFTNFDGLVAAMPIFEKYHHWKQHTCITVTSQRMLEWSKFNGFAKVHLLNELTNTALCALSRRLIDKD